MFKNTKNNIFSIKQIMKKIYVFDTNILLSDPDCFYKFYNNDIIIPFKVLEEVDKHKKRMDIVGANARSTIRILDDLRKNGSLTRGVKIDKKYGSIKVLPPTKSIQNLDITIPDNEIINTALQVKEELTKNNKKNKVIVISQDINMRVKCDSVNLISENYEIEHLEIKNNELYTGYCEYLVDDQIIEKFYSGERIFLKKKDIKLFPNQFLMLISNSNNKKTALCRFTDYETPLRKIPEYKSIFGISAKNKEQAFALDLLMDDTIPVVSLIGLAGSGKTILALAAGLQKVINDEKYNKLLVSRPIQPVGKEIGYLPGSLSEKILPWLQPIQDNLRYLMGNDKLMLEEYIHRGVIETEAMTYIRGRSISNAFIIFDEIQNTNIHEIKTILTRVGENTKIILTGDIHQIDNIYVNELTNGLTNAVEKFKSQLIGGHITLQKGERSKVATISAEIF